MKAIRWIGWVALAALCMVPLATTPAAAASFSFTFDGCDGDTVCVTPVLGGVPDSIQWIFSNGPTTAGYDFVPPFDTCFLYNGDTGVDGDTLVMHAWFAAADSIIKRFIIADYLVTVDDGRDCNENDSVLVDVLANDSLFFADADSIQILNPLANGPFNGSIYKVDSVYSIWYVPDPGYNGTDIFAYRVWTACGQQDTAVVAITILSDGRLSIDSVWYDWVDVPCPNSCDTVTSGTISVGDSLRVCVRIAAWDLDELAAGFPKVYLPGLGANPGSMIKDTSVTLGLLDSTVFCYPARTLDSNWLNIIPGNLDVAAGFYDIITEVQSNATPFLINRDTIQFQEPIDTRVPVDGSGLPTWTLWSDVNGDGVATTIDTMRFFLDLRNEPFGEICKVSVTTYGFPTFADTGVLANTYSLYEIAGDNRWARILEVPPGDLDNSDGPYTAVFHFWDNACNEDSVSITYNDEVDNSAPLCSGITSIYQRLIDLDSNNCLRVGETVRIRIFDTVNTGDVISYYLDLFGDTLSRMGLGSADSTDSSHVRVPLNNLGGGWWGVDWVLGAYPLRNAIDTVALAGVVPWVWLHAYDDAGNPLDCDSLKIIWSDPNPFVNHIDARVPEPVTMKDCLDETTFNGSRAAVLRFYDWASDAAHFRLFWDHGTGVIDYQDTLAGLSWGDPGLDTSANGDTLYWSTDGTIDLSWCRDYLFTVWTIDGCGNLEAQHPDSILCPGNRPDPVVQLSCVSLDGGAIELTWKSFDSSVTSFEIYYGLDSVNMDAAVDTVPAVMGDTLYTWSTDDAGLALIDKGWYEFAVVAIDTCGNRDTASYPTPDENTTTTCLSDLAPAVACVIQPDTGGVWCGNNPLTIYVCPDTTADRDVISVTAWGRLADSGDGQPGEWVALGGGITDSGSVCFQINLNPSALNEMVGFDTTQLIQIVITTVDEAGKETTPDSAWAFVDGCVPFHFYWSTEVIQAWVPTINGQVATQQAYCNEVGWTVSGSTNSVTTCLTDSGVGPYWVLAYLDDEPAIVGIQSEPGGDDPPPPLLQGDEIFYGQGEPECVTFNLDVTHFTKGGSHTLSIHWVDACGSDTWTTVNLCIPDSNAPCAEVTNPVDGKCIRRSWSTLDTLFGFQISIKGNDLTPGGEGCIDQNNVLKVDFQWSTTCCIEAGIETRDTSWFEIRPCEVDTTTGLYAVCDTFPAGAIGFAIDSVVCVDTAASCTRLVRVDSTIVDTLSCNDQWRTFAIDSAIDVIDGQGGRHHHGPKYYADWMNYNDLAWITASGTNIWIRGIVYDDQGNVFYTPCVQVCVDIDTPPLCIRTEDLCDTNSISGNAKIFAELNWPLGNVDDIEHIYLYTKKTHDPDVFSSWESWGDGDRATNATMWVWDLRTAGHHGPDYFQDQTYYDFRVIAKTITGSWSYDFNGDEQFDAHTFDTANCDAKTWLVDNDAPSIAIDTAWTTINGNVLVIPNTDCRLSDPKGYIWTQYGHSITVQPTVYPLGDLGDIVKTQWTLFDGSGRDGANCDCRGPYSDFDDNGADSYVFAVKEGAHAMDNLVFDPTLAPFVHVRNGYQHHVLYVQGWDACGNETEDCVEIYLLDIDTTEAVIIDPMNDEVFCDQLLSDGGIELTAATLLDERFKEAVFAYRPLGSSTWIPIDSVTSWHHDGTHHTLSVIWYPKALGLPDGSYEVVVWAVDAALNRQTTLYPITIHLSCAQPVVALTYPTTESPEFLGCPLELTATASSGDPYNPIIQVDFYVQNALDDEAHWIGSDDYTIDGTWSVHWNPKDTLLGGFNLSDGYYYIYATAKNLAQLTTKSAMVVVKYDETAPWSYVIQVNGDRSDGGSADPTIVTAGETVPLYVLAADNQSPIGYGLTNNCGLDSVIIYVSNDSGRVIFGSLMTPVGGALDSLFTVDWPTAGWPTGKYHVWSRAVDCACNSSTCNCNWYVEIVNPVPGATISVCVPEDDHHDGFQTDGYHHGDTCIPAVVICDTVSVKRGTVNIDLVPAPYGDIAEVQIWLEYASLSDVQDLWTLVGLTQTMDDGIFRVELDVDTLPEGTYRLRAFYRSISGQWIDDGNSDGDFDDFTFDPDSKPWQMWLRIDRSVAPFTMALNPTMTLEAGRQINVTVTSEVPCDVTQICYGAVAENGYSANATNGCVDSTHFAFNPVDSGLVSLNHGIFHGSIRTTLTDALGNTSYVDTPLWILDMDSNQVRITSPLWGAYVTGIGDTLVKSVTARKLTSASIDSVVFFYDPLPAGTGTRFGKATSTVGSDEFMADWNIKNVPEGEQYIWGVAYKNSTQLDNNPIKTWVIIIKTPKDIQLAVDTAHSIYAYRTVGPDKILFVGERADLGLDKDAISSIVSGVGIDSVVFYFRYADAPGGFVSRHPDPEKGWVRIGADRYGSLHTDWFTPQDDSHGYHGHHGYGYGHGDDEDCYDGQYAVAAWVYDRAGQVNHSNIVLVNVDNTDPYSEIVDIDGDEAFGTCHDITVTGTQTTVKFTAVAIDDRSCIGSTPAYNSGAKTLQFFVGKWEPSEDVGVIWGSDLVPLADGQDNAFALWNPTGLRTGTYKVWTMVTDQLGNSSTSKSVKLCVYDKTPPVGYIAGFGVSTDEHMVHEYKIYGASWDTDIDHVQIQYRRASSNSETDWTGIGISKSIGHHDPFCWYTTWNPCAEATGDYVFRMVPTDESGNEDFAIQPILRVHVAACAITPLDASQVGVGFEDRAFDNLGMVNLTNAPTDKHTSMIAVYADLDGEMRVEQIDLRQDVGDETHFMATFDDGVIRKGGIGWFWAAYNDFANHKTYLKKAEIKVYLVDDVGFPGTLVNTELGASVELQPEALTSRNGVVMFPARNPTVWKNQLHLRAWPISANSEMLTSIRLTDRSYAQYTGDSVSIQGGWWGHGGFNEGKYARITISYYAPDIPTSDLAIAWWDGNEWNTTHGLLAGGEIKNGKATFFSDDLYGIYAVVSESGVFWPGALEVQHTTFMPSVGNTTNAYPRFHTIVRSKLSGQHENSDIDEDKIIVTLDGVTIFTDYEAAAGWSGRWDEVSGLLSLKPHWNPDCGDYYDDGYDYGDGGSAKPTILSGLTAGPHWIKVQAFTKQGYWNFDSTSFTVDDAQPKVDVSTSYVCPNPTFTFDVTDASGGAGVNWDSVYADVFDIEGSVFSGVPKERLLFTASPDVFTREGNTLSFTVNATWAEGRRLRMVIYDGTRYIRTNKDCSCEWVYYDYPCHGAPDMVGNHTQVTEMLYTVSAVACGTDDSTGGTVIIVPPGQGSHNPFDPTNGEFVQFALHGFAAGGGTISAAVYDLTGERVAGLGINTLQGSAAWYGKTDDGDVVADGVYLVHFQRTGGTGAGSNSQVLKVVVKRR